MVGPMIAPSTQAYLSWRPLPQELELKCLLSQTNYQVPVLLFFHEKSVINMKKKSAIF